MDDPIFLPLCIDLWTQIYFFHKRHQETQNPILMKSYSLILKSPLQHVYHHDNDVRMRKSMRLLVRRMRKIYCKLWHWR